MVVAERGKAEPALLPLVLGVEGGDLRQAVVVTGVLLQFRDHVRQGMLGLDVGSAEVDGVEARGHRQVLHHSVYDAICLKQENIVSFSKKKTHPPGDSKIFTGLVEI